MYFLDIITQLLGERMELMITEICQHSLKHNIDISTEDQGVIIRVILREISEGHIVSPHISQGEAINALDIIYSIETPSEHKADKRNFTRIMEDINRA